MTSPNPPSTPPADQRWYREGLRFSCTACGNCCRDHGEHTYVYVSSGDLKGLAAQLEMSEAQFEDKYCDHEDGWRFLRRTGGACVFLNKKGLCDVYEARPKQCATWPFWQDNLASKKTWTGPVKKCCPGIDTGELKSADEAERIATETEAWYEDDES
jgi:Fe-S-cluster containining protein